MPSTNRQDWEFEHPISEILGATDRRAKYHRARLEYWKKTLDGIVQDLPKTVNVDSYEEFVNASQFSNSAYGQPSLQLDPKIQKQFSLAVKKVASHRTTAELYERWIAVLSGEKPERTLKLTMDDIEFFSLHEKDLDKWIQQDEKEK